MGSGSPFAEAPPVIAALLPELADTAAGEPRADCARCPMVAEPAPPPWSFAAATRCCTYHPFLVSFRAGAALARGGDGAAGVTARLADAVGLSALGIAPQPARAVRQRAGRDFGQDAALRCPFWVGGDHACGVWHDRPPTCRGWYCKHDDGLGGAVAWTRAAELAGEVEVAVARRLIALGSPPDPASADVEAWDAWYRWCAARVLTLDGAEVEALRTAVPAAAREELVTIRRRPPRVLAERVVPSVSELHHGGERIWITGYSSFDAAVVPASVFAFLAALDGVTTWREALARAPEITETMVRELHRVGALRAVDGRDDLPFAVEPQRASASEQR